MRKESAITRLPRLVGERANAEEDPRRNTAIQRSWMYADDPALFYALNGIQSNEDEAGQQSSVNVSFPDRIQDSDEKDSLRTNRIRMAATI